MRYRFYTNKEIDKNRWDQALSEMDNALIYPYSYYLDAVTQNQWGAFVGDDYSWLFPILLKNKMFFNDARQPLFTQQLGMFAKNSITQLDFRKVLGALDRKAQLVNIQIHPHLKIDNHEAFNIKTRNNYVLNLNHSYDTLKSNFSSNTKRNIKKGEKANQKIIEIDIDRFVQFYAAFYKKMGIKKSHLKIFYNLLRVLKEKNQLEIRAVSCKDDVNAVAAWCNTNDRVYYLAGVSNESGKMNRSMFLLQNSMIQEQAGQTKVYDFEGSMVQGVARFFAGFGATPVTYYHLYKNKLPFFMRRFY